MKKYGFLIIMIAALLSCSDCESDEVHFVGDSLIECWDIPYFFPGRHVINHGVSGSQIDDVYKWGIATHRKKVVLLIGTNNLTGNVLSDAFRESFVDSYLGLVEYLNAEKLIVISLLPREVATDNENMNSDIAALNRELKSNLSAMENVYFLNAFDFFVKGQKLNPSYYKDGLHLNYYGYELLSSLLKMQL